MSDDILDLSRANKRRALKPSHGNADHVWQAAGRNGVQRCQCGQTFPCVTRCVHVDCIVRRAELMAEGKPLIVGERLPDDFPFCMTFTHEIRGGRAYATEHVVLDTTPDNPDDWTDPFEEIPRLVRKLGVLR